MTTDTITIDTPSVTPEQEQILKELETSGVFKKSFPDFSIFGLLVGMSLIPTLLVYLGQTSDNAYTLVELFIKFCTPYVVLCLYVLIARVWYHGQDAVFYLREDIVSLTTKGKIPDSSTSTYLNFNGIYLFSSMSLFFTFMAFVSYCVTSKDLYVSDISLNVYLLILMSVIWIPINVYIGLKNEHNRTSYLKSLYKLTGHNLYSGSHSESLDTTPIVKTTSDTDELFEKESQESETSHFFILVCINFVLCAYAIFAITQYNNVRIQSTTSLITVLESYISKENTLIKDLNNTTSLKIEHENCKGSRCVEIEQTLGSNIDTPIAELNTDKLLVNKKKLESLLLAAKENRLPNFIGLNIELTEFGPASSINISVLKDYVWIKTPNRLKLHYSFNHN